MKFLGLLLIFVSSFAFAKTAEVKTTWEVFPLNGQARFEMGDQQELAPRQALNLAFGAQRSGYGALIEVSQFSVKTGSSYSGVDRDHTELVAWLRKDFAGISNLRWLIGGGLGLSRDEITTRIDALSRTDDSKAEPLAAFALGPQLTLWNIVRVSLEGRLFFGQGFDPNPQPDAVLRTGFAF